jgi:ABC-type antimicrobial peptide transport system permease subunit
MRSSNWTKHSSPCLRLSICNRTEGWSEAIRIALGAGQFEVLWMVLRESLLVVVCGMAVGLPAAILLTRFVANMLFGVQQFDGPAIAGAVLILAAAGVAAGLLPACRASRIDPIKALRYE